MDNEHSRYANPTITEAICAIHFQLPQSKGWQPSLPGEIFRLFQDEFPIMEPVFEMGLQFEVGPSGTGTKILPPPQMVRFKHATRPLVLQIAENTFSINILAPYLGWKETRTYALDAWQKVETILKPEIITRIGLRYINGIAKETAQDRLHDWLAATEYVPEGILRSEAGFFLRLQSHLDRENILIITLGDTVPDTESTHGTVIFDLDRITEREMAPNQQALENLLNILHNDIWNTFSAAKGEKLEALLRRREL